VWASAALDAWDVLARDAFVVRGARVRVLDGPRGDEAPTWPLAHVLWAAGDVARLGVDVPVRGLVAGLERFRRGEAYAATVGGRRFYDDNAWVGLASLGLGLDDDPAAIGRATRLSAFVRRGETRRGGVRWAERSPSRNACSTAPAAWLALEVAARTADQGSEPVAFAERVMAWLQDTLMRPDGLVADRITSRGKVVNRPWSYNQGAAIAARRRLGRPTAPLSDAALTRFHGERLWREPPAFASILFRALLERPDPQVLSVLDPYLERLIGTAREPSTGWYTAGGVGSYDGHPTIDQAAVVQLLALRSRAP